MIIQGMSVPEPTERFSRTRYWKIFESEHMDLDLYLYADGTWGLQVWAKFDGRLFNFQKDISPEAAKIVLDSIKE